MNRKRAAVWTAVVIAAALAGLGFAMSAGAGGSGVGHSDQGAIGADLACTAVTCPDVGVVAQLNKPAKQVLDDNHVIVVAGQCTSSDNPADPAAHPCADNPNTETGVSQSEDEDTAKCPSTWANKQLPSDPQAAKGYACVYVLGGTNFGTVVGGGAIHGVSIAPGSLGSKLGFKIVWNPNVAGDSYVDAVWAYNKS